ncbi:MAG TPA: GMC family oxidoreductase [Bryobacteraceae bacterium]|nr:GMC family oxidoreductase [Bryobacteraceae bacterium]
MKFDVCIVGSGHGGGAASYALTKAGLKVALVEAGPRLRAGIDYGKHTDPYEVLEDRLLHGIRSPLESLFRDRGERNHFTGVGDSPNHGLLKAVGGRSLCWAGHSLRFGPLDFQKWPMPYEEVAPYYSRVERLMGVYGYKDGLSNMPDGEYTKPVPMRCGESMLKRGVARLKSKGYKMEFVAQRKAMVTEPHFSGRAMCHFCGKCGNCCVDAKYTAANTAIPLALRTGNLTLFSDSTMTRIRMNREETRVTGIEYRKGDGATEKVECGALVLACSTIETARQLLLHRSKRFPNGLANGSGQVGRNLTSHFGLTVIGFFPQLRGRDASNDDGTGYYGSLLTGMYWDKPSANFEGTYQVQCGAGYMPLSMPVRDVPGYGVKFKREWLEKNICNAGMNMQGSLLPSARKFVDLDETRKDRLGIALPRVHLHYEQNDLNMARDVVEKCCEIIEAGGGEVVSKPSAITPANMAIDYNHWVGTARMGRDARTSVVNPYGQSHEVKNLFLGDASVFPHYPEKNPVLTIASLSWRMSDYLAGQAKKGAL